MFKKEAFTQGYMLGVKLARPKTEKTAGWEDLPTSALLFMAGLPILGGISTATLHHGLGGKDYKEESKQLLRRYRVKAIQERNKQLMKDIEAKKSLNQSFDIGE